jgi:hypothetical protein
MAAPQGPAPAGGHGGNPFADFSANKLWDSGKPKPPVGDYIVQVIKCIFKQAKSGAPAFIAEYVVTDSTNPECQPGFESSMFQQMGEIGASYVANWVADAMGIDKNDKSQVAAVLQSWQAVAWAAVSGQPQQTSFGVVGPELIIGKKMRLSVRPPKDGGQYNKEIWGKV